MSHTTSIKGLAIKDVAALRAAAAKLKSQGINCSLAEDVKPRMYYSDQHGKCPYVLQLHDGQYDVGFELQADGSYSPVFDEWGSHVSRHLGATCPLPSTPEGKAQHQIGKFLTAYAVEAATNAAIAQGYYVESSDIDQQGNVNLVLAGM